MGQILESTSSLWSNYHRTVQARLERRLAIAGDEAGNVPAADYFRGTCAAVQQEIRAAQLENRNICPIGASWSFSEIVQPEHWLLQTIREDPDPGGAWEDGFSGSGRIYLVEPSQKHNPDDSANLVLVGGGAKIADLNVWLDAHRLSLRTSGASNGQSVAGAIATSIHGSVPSFGAFQDHVRGLHLVTGAEESVWLEPAGRPGLNPAFAQKFATRIEMDDELFNAALVHLGAMGHINAVLLEVADAYLLEVVQLKKAITHGDVKKLQDGDFEGFAKALGLQGDPYFVQVILNPFFPFEETGIFARLLNDPLKTVFDVITGKKAPFAMSALHRLFFLRPDNGQALMMPIPESHQGEPVSLISQVLDAFGGVLPGENVALVTALMSDLFGLYKTIGGPGEPPTLMRWSQTTPAHQPQEKLFSTAFAFDRSDLLRALKVALPAFRAFDGAPLVCTLRFVSKSAGTLALTPHENNVVIDFDGIDCDASPAAIARIEAALLKERISYRRHLGKIGTIDAARIRHDFGDPNEAGTPARRWRTARDTLLKSQVRPVFGSQALRTAGLI